MINFILTIYQIFNFFFQTFEQRISFYKNKFAMEQILVSILESRSNRFLRNSPYTSLNLNTNVK